MAIGNIPLQNEKGIVKRKTRHHEICVDRNQSIEGKTRDIDLVRFIHQADPGLHIDHINTHVSFLGYGCHYPFFISCMTGGSPEGFRANKNLALAAQESHIPIGTGSIRILYSQAELFEHFHIKPLAPDVPVLANLSLVQLRDLPHKWIKETLSKMEADALVLHCNPGQELFQNQGDRDFTGLFDSFKRFAESKKLPLIIKETGFGISPEMAQKYLQAGADYIDLASRGGSNWILIEEIRDHSISLPTASLFEDWGNDLCASLIALQNQEDKIIASGGIRSGIDVAKVIALGAKMAGLALPFIQAENINGKQGILSKIDEISKDLKAVMMMSGSKDIKTLSRTGLLINPEILETARQLAQNGDWRNQKLSPPSSKA